MKYKDIGRNDPCPCGSGKKYKKCCLGESAPPFGGEDAVKERLTRSLVEFAETYHRPALKKAFKHFWRGDSIPAEIPSGLHPPGMINFMEWFVHDRVLDERTGKTLIDLYIEKTKAFSAEEREILGRMKDAVISLYEIQEHHFDEGFVLKDIVQGGMYDVSEKMATRSLMKWDVFAARLLFLDGKYIIAGSLYPFPIRKKNDMVGRTMQHYTEYIAEHPGSTLKEFLKTRAGEFFNHAWCDHYIEPEPVYLHNTSGDPMMLSTAVFDIIHAEHLHEKLASAKHLERDGEERDVYRWAGDTRSMENVSLGMITIAKGRLTLECNSRKRLSRGKKLLMKYLAGDISHRADTFDEPDEMIEDVRNRTVPHEPIRSEIPGDMEQEIYTAFMDKHNKDWINMSVPALNGQTPRQAVKTKSGRLKVLELLKQFENAEEHNRLSGSSYYDTSWMWKALGLAKE